MAIKVGDRVKIVGNVSGDYIGDEGVVTCTSRKNMMNRPLVDVQLNPSHHSTCFFPSELEILNKEITDGETPKRQ